MNSAKASRGFLHLGNPADIVTASAVALRHRDLIGFRGGAGSIRENLRLYGDGLYSFPAPTPA